MHILFFTPYFNQPRGNSTTSKRIIHFLQEKGVETSVFPYLEKDVWNRPTPDVIHILHATRFVLWQRETGYTLERPYIVTMGGTDINLDLQSEISSDVRKLLDEASAITVFTADAKQKVEQLCQSWGGKTEIISQTAWISWKIKKTTNYIVPHILLPAGLRPVKDVLHVMPALDELALEFPDMTFTIIGANLDEKVFEQVKATADSRPWMKYAGVVPLDVMASWYNRSNIVINTSISEGQSLAVMEAMSIGRPVVARCNSANLSLISHQQTGWLYETNEQFKQAIYTIMTESTLREQVVQNAMEWIKKTATPEQEAEKYIALYKRAGE